MIVQVDLSARDADASAAFYGAVLGRVFEPMDVGAHRTFRAQVASVTWVIAPDALTGADANGSRVQLELAVDDLDRRFAAGLAHGGTELEPISGKPGRRVASLRDPDGCSVVLRES